MSRSGDQQRVTMSPDDLMAAVLAHEASLPDGGGTGYELPPDLAQHVSPEFQAWDGLEAFFDSSRREAATRDAAGEGVEGPSLPLPADPLRGLVPPPA